MRKKYHGGVTNKWNLSEMVRFYLPNTELITVVISTTTRDKIVIDQRRLFFIPGYAESAFSIRLSNADIFYQQEFRLIINFIENILFII